MKIFKMYVVGIILAASNACSMIASESNSIHTIAAVIDSPSNNLGPTIVSFINDSEMVSAVSCGCGVLEKYSNKVLIFRFPSGNAWIAQKDRIYKFDKNGCYKGNMVRE